MSLLVSICYLKFEIVFPAMSDQSKNTIKLFNRNPFVLINQKLQIPMRQELFPTRNQTQK